MNRSQQKLRSEMARKRARRQRLVACLRQKVDQHLAAVFNGQEALKTPGQLLGEGFASFFAREILPAVIYIDKLEVKS